MSAILKGLTVDEGADVVNHLQQAHHQARQITKAIKYDGVAEDIVVQIQLLAEKCGIDPHELEYAIDQVRAARSKLVEAVYGLDELFEEALTNATNAEADEEENEELGEGVDPFKSFPNKGEPSNNDELYLHHMDAAKISSGKAKEHHLQQAAKYKPKGKFKELPIEEGDVLNFPKKSQARRAILDYDDAHKIMTPDEYLRDKDKIGDHDYDPTFFGGQAIAVRYTQNNRNPKITGEDSVLKGKR
jgi:hypothetical protein